MNRIFNWPAHGDIGIGQDYWLAPFYDYDNSGDYDPNAGDIPWYDDILGRDDVECGIDRRVTLFGDEIKETFTQKQVVIQLVWKLERKLLHLLRMMK